MPSGRLCVTRRTQKNSFDVNSSNAVRLNALPGCDPCAQRQRRIVTLMYSDQLTAAMLDCVWGCSLPVAVPNSLFH